MFRGNFGPHLRVKDFEEALLEFRGLVDGFEDGPLKGLQGKTTVEGIEAGAVHEGREDIAKAGGVEFTIQRVYCPSAIWDLAVKEHGGECTRNMVRGKIKDWLHQRGWPAKYRHVTLNTLTHWMKAYPGLTRTEFEEKLNLECSY